MTPPDPDGPQLRPPQPEEPDPSVTALRAWRDAQVNAGRLTAGVIRDTVLRQVVRFTDHTAPDIAKKLPSNLQTYAGAMAEVLRSRREPTTPAAGPEPTDPSFEAKATSAEPAGGLKETVGASGFAKRDLRVKLDDHSSRLEIDSTGNGVRLSWQAPSPPAAVEIYRVVASDEGRPLAPESAEHQLGQTRELKAADRREFIKAIRYYQVWRNSGSTEQSARVAQPILHAEGVAVAPVHNVQVSDADEVVGLRWQVRPGVQRVQVFRQLADAAVESFHEGTKIFDEEVTHAQQSCNDRGVEGGQAYRYVFYALARAGEGLVRSNPVIEPFKVATVLRPINDLQVIEQAGGGGPQFDLCWPALAAGEVIIYRTAKEPEAGSQRQIVKVDGLEQAGLPKSARLKHQPIPDGAGRMKVLGVGCPADWDRVHFTPVTILDGDAQIGESVLRVRVLDVTDLMLTERCSHQLLTFAWPGSASSVEIHRGARGQPWDPARGGTSEQISRADYRLLGGFSFPEPLPSEGCTVHVAGVTHAGGGRRVVGKVASVDYPGLSRLYYQLKWGRIARSELQIRVRSERETAEGFTFVLVHNPNRLPLHSGEGRPVPVVLDVEEGGKPQIRFGRKTLPTQFDGPAWKADLRGLRGYVRLFAELPAGHEPKVAVFDPDVKSLRIPE